MQGSCCSGISEPPTCAPPFPPPFLFIPPPLKGKGSSPDSWHPSLPCYIELYFMYLPICLPRLWTPLWLRSYFTHFFVLSTWHGAATQQAAWWWFLVKKNWSCCLGLSSCCPSPRVSNPAAYVAFPSGHASSWAVSSAGNPSLFPTGKSYLFFMVPSPLRLSFNIPSSHQPPQWVSLLRILNALSLLVIQPLRNHQVRLKRKRMQTHTWSSMPCPFFQNPQFTFSCLLGLGRGGDGSHQQEGRAAPVIEGHLGGYRLVLK